MERESFPRRAHRALRFFVRFLVGTLLITYAAPKLLGVQFQLMNYVPELPLGKIGGFWLAWAFFGHSYYYQLVIGLGEITCAFLLFFRRTQTLGALCAFPIVANVTLVDFAFEVNNAKSTALLLLVGVLYLLASDFPKLKAFFWNQQEGASGRRSLIASALYSVAILALSLGLIAYLVKSNKNDWDGVYQIESYSINGAPQPLGGGENFREPKLFMDFNGGSYLSLNGKDTRGHCLFDAGRHEFTWIADNKHPETTLKGTYQLDASSLALQGKQNADSVAITLKRLR